MKKIKLLACVLLIVLGLCSCFAGNDVRDYSSSYTDYEVLINKSFCIAFTFKDPATGVWYIGGGEGGICPRYNADGSLFVTD